jgi:hypothetical protein
MIVAMMIADLLGAIRDRNVLWTSTSMRIYTAFQTHPLVQSQFLPVVFHLVHLPFSILTSRSPRPTPAQVH